MGSFPEEAFYFVREGLSLAVQRIHGPETRAHRAINGFLHRRKIDLAALSELYYGGRLSGAVAAAIEEVGGIDKLNRHVSGNDMCWALRDYALCRWGLLASLVLESWKIRETYDFGKLVFAMIEHDLMQKQPGDSIEDFSNVYEFREALDDAYRITLDRCG